MINEDVLHVVDVDDVVVVVDLALFFRVSALRHGGHRAKGSPSA